MATVTLTGGPGGSPAAAQAQATAREILAERRFHAVAIPRPLHGFLHEVGKLWHALTHPFDVGFGSVSGSLPGGAATLWAILAALVLALAAVITARSTRRVLRAGADGIGPSADGRRTAAALEEAALLAERDGHLQEAVRLRFQAGLMRLAERELIDPAATTPNAQVRRELRSPRFDALAQRFDEIVYGGDEARAEDVEVARREWPLLVGGER